MAAQRPLVESVLSTTRATLEFEFTKETVSAPHAPCRRIPYLR